ncbi:serotransferrin [Tachyglossus aculeatus]|uniref:serotransferrin n=1 Tax=Tachyglossus aculeatus TaxID=9261 RepID=UPI0018F72AE0|nr:serotransferrin [Tachyglossus aculeatus]
MRASVLSALLSCWILGLCLATPEKNVRWCVTSDSELKKCNELKEEMKEATPTLSCVKKTSSLECIKAIAENEADGITVDGGLVYEAGLAPYNLKPIVAEDYGTRDHPNTHYFTVAVGKRGTGFQFKDLSGKKSCHTGLGRFAGWIMPIGRLLDLNLLKWPGAATMPIEKAVAKFFSASCVPCAAGKDPDLCRLCKGVGNDKCACSDREPYYGYSGAFKCLKEGAGDVCFVKHTTVLENLKTQEEQDKFELLCEDDSRKPVSEYLTCNLAQVPAHAVVARSVDGKRDLIWDFLRQAQEKFGKDKPEAFQLFSSPHGKDLLFKDSANRLLNIPPKMDSALYLGYKTTRAIQNLRKEKSTAESKKVLWCTVSKDEKAKCDQWSAVSGGAVECAVAETTEDCIAKIMKGEADAISLDGGFVYTAGKCGLVPVLAESYAPLDTSVTPDCVKRPAEGYYTVAVAKKSDPNLKWGQLKGKKSCHTGVGRTAGWNIPMGLLYNQTHDCKFGEYFSESCAPGSDVNSNLCALCAGNPKTDQVHKCVANSNEQYYGYTGAFRCLVEKGDVAFVKDSTVLENTNGLNSDPWAKDLKSDDFELLCLDGTRKPVTEAKTCHLAQAPTHAVVSRPDKADVVRQVLLNQQELYGSQGSEKDIFELFKSNTKDLLFKDSTVCLSDLKDKTTYQKFLGPEYLAAVSGLSQCSTSELLAVCNFHSE